MCQDNSKNGDVVASALRGRSLDGVESWEFGWSFKFSGDVRITTQQLWRVLTSVGIAVTSEDDKQKFGLPEAVDAGQWAIGRLVGPVTEGEVQRNSGDLRIVFNQEAVLEFLNTSLGYEGWHLVAPQGDRRTTEIVALGGGDLAIWH